MATTPNLGLALPAHGSDQDTWDQPLNNNFTIIDGIVGGGAASSVLTGNGPNSAPTFQTISSLLPGGIGTVTQVGLTAPAELVVGGSPITTAGSISLSKATQPANQVWAGPTSGGVAQPTFRSLVAADLPFSLPNFTAAPMWYGSFEGGPFQWTGGGNGLWGVAGGAGANVVKFCMIRVPFTIAVSKLTYYQLSIVAGSFSGFAWYNSLGTVKLFSWDNIDTGTGSAGTKTTTIGQVVIPGGIYIAACACSSNTATASTLGGFGTGGTNEPVEPWNTNGTIRTGVASNVLSAGIMPASLGTLSVSAGVGTSLPYITLEP